MAENSAAGPPSAAKVAERYAQDVLRGRIVACELTRLACRRHLDDLKRWGRRPRRAAPYWFDAAAAQHAVDFFGVCRHIEGEWGGQIIVPQPFQVFATACIFGWMRADGTRRFRTVYLEEARKNGKSTMAAVWALYLLVADGENGAQVYTVATTFSQAEVVFKPAKHMVLSEPELLEKINVWSKSLEMMSTASALKPLHSKSRSNEGWNTHGAIMDELHAHPTAEMWDVIKQSMGARSQPLIVAITTAGDNQGGICYEQRDYLCSVLRGTLQDESYYGVIYTLDDGDDWQDPAVWPKANPGLGTSPKLVDITTEAAQARATPRAANTFRTKRLNVWVGAQNAYYDVDLWRSLSKPGLAAEDWPDAALYVGIDLAMIRDVAAVIYLFARPTGDLRTVATLDEQGAPVERQVPEADYGVLSRLYLPESTLADLRTGMRAQYRGWADAGHLTVTPGNSIDYQYIKQDLLAVNARHPIVEVEYDPHMATQLMQELTAEGIETNPVNQGAKSLNMPMQELDKLMADRRIRHDGNPMLTWMVGNTVGVSRYGGKYVGPAKPERQEWKKIDGVVALQMALMRAMADAGPGGGTIQNYEFATV